MWCVCERERARESARVTCDVCVCEREREREGGRGVDFLLSQNMCRSRD